MAVRGDQGAGNIYSDDFQNATLDATYWPNTNTPGTSSISIVGAGTGQAVCRLSMPADQDYFHPNSSVWIEQTGIANESFVLEAWFDVPAIHTENGVQLGIGIYEATRTAGYFDVSCYTTGTSLFVELKDEATTVGSDAAFTVTSTLGLRLQFDHESGGTDSDSVTGFYNDDSGGWTQVGNAVTGVARTIEAIRVYGGRYTPAGAYDVDIDWVWDTSAPITAEDALPSTSRRVMVIS